jgi:3-methyladenine DNA glycosylase AlkC
MLLKDLLDRETVRWLSESLARAYPAFDDKAFTKACLNGLKPLELKERASHIAMAMHRFLPGEFPAAARIIAASLGPEVPPTGENGVAVLRYMPHDNFIERFGLDHPQAAFKLQEEVTKRASCEFSIRAFLSRHRELTHTQMLAWAKSANTHLRRLASEGLRPRLPWGQRLADLIVDPTPVITLLELLKDDPERYVQRSVANSINDISKDHPDLAVALCNRWLVDAPPARLWLIRHALRHLVKKGHSGALALMGAGKPPEIRIESVKLSPTRLRIGDWMQFSLDVISSAESAQDLIVDYVVFYVKARGKVSPKVFKLATISLAAGEKAALKSSLSFADMTTRKHYPGSHRLALQVNGTAFELAAFELHPS